MTDAPHERRRAYLAAAADTSLREQAGFIPLLANGLGDLARPAIEQNLVLNRRRQDCVDFRLNMLLRAEFLCGKAIPADLRAGIRENLSNALYYGCYSATRPLFRNSENHHLQYAVAEYLAAQLLEGEVFCDGRTAREHLDRSRGLILRWLDRRLRYGYCEWNSSVYMAVNLAALLNLLDFARDAALRRQAETAVTRLLADLAGESLDGAVFGAQARIYQEGLLDPARQTVQPAFALWFGLGTPPVPRETHHLNLADCVATSRYEPPAWLLRAARHAGGRWVVRERHRTELGPLYKNRSLFWQPPEELTDEAAMRRF